MRRPAACHLCRTKTTRPSHPDTCTAALADTGKGRIVLPTDQEARDPGPPGERPPSSSMRPENSLCDRGHHGRTAQVGVARRLPGRHGGTTIGTPRPGSRPLLLRVAFDDQLQPRLDLEVVLKDIALVVESEEVVLRCADLDEFRHS